MSDVTSKDSVQNPIPPPIQEALETAVKRNGFTKPRYVVELGSGAGDNYLSLLFRVKVTDDKDDSRQLSVIVKSQVLNAMLRGALKLHRAFANEATVYSEILPAYAERLVEVGLLDDGAHYPDAPRCLLASAGRGVDEEEDVVILQDMRPEGFAMLDRHQGVDLPHCRLVLRALADLHASSLALECRQPQRFQRIKDSLIEVLQEDINAVVDLESDSFMKYALEMIEVRHPEGSPVYEKTREYFRTAHKDRSLLVSALSEGGNVICHGDCWTNNLLFKHSESGKVERVCFVDFQIARYASPVLDLVFFLYTCTDRSLRAAHLDSLLREYHARLQARMRALGVPDPDAVFSWQRMESHLRQRARFGLLMAFLSIPIFTATKGDAPNLSERLDGGTEMRALLAVKPKDPTERDRRVSDVVEEMLERGYF